MATIYVQLLGENVDVWRPVDADPVGEGTLRVLFERPASEKWAVEAAVGQLVRCERRTLSDGLAWVISEADPLAVTTATP